MAAGALAVSLAVGADAAEPDLTSLRQARTAVLVVTESYTSLRNLDDRGRPVDATQVLRNVELPVRSVVEATLRHAGVALQRDGTAAANLRITVDIGGTTTGQLYDASIDGRRIRELRYTDAKLVGALSFGDDTIVVERTFTGDIPPAVSIIAVVDGGDTRRDPRYAPFRAAFEAPGGFLDVLAATIQDIWGDPALRAALADRDPLVREAARRGLARQQ
jgi:hypothetical protein